MKADIFDEVTKTLATATTRRQALWRIGGILGGTALAGLIPGVALADNSDCAHFCNSVFDPGPDRGQCKSDAAHGTGLCYTCGPASPGGAQPICCPTNSDGTCTSYSSATCCSSGQVCQNGTCVTPCQGLQQPCTSASQCCDNGQGKTTCEMNASGVAVCCHIPGGSCSNDYDCCGDGTYCAGGTCQCSTTFGGCYANTDCCSGTCIINSSYGGYCA